MRKTGLFYFIGAVCLWNGAAGKTVQGETEDVMSQIVQEEAVNIETEAVQGEADGSASENQQMIRVLLTDTSQSSYYHERAVITQSGRTETYTANSPALLDGPVILADEGGGICVESISRQGISPVYEGTLEIRSAGEGLLLINELPLETYLEAVVPSEMPSDYGLEALKAQAICARTYACRQMEERRLEDYGADVDDSVSFQVYRNVPPQERASQAVEETKGQVLTWNGELIEAYYFSTSAGATSTDEVWGVQEAAAYLKSVPCTFDEASVWSSWEVRIPWEVLSQRAQELAGCGGELRYLAPMAVNGSGAVTELCVYTEAGTGILEDEYEVREFLAPAGQTITGKDGRELSCGELLPSAYITLEATPGKEVHILGGGYGHGVGMSQNAANVMAQEGDTCEEILHYFFQDVEICSLSQLATDTKS